MEELTTTTEVFHDPTKSVGGWNYGTQQDVLKYLPFCGSWSAPTPKKWSTPSSILMRLIWMVAFKWSGLWERPTFELWFAKWDSLFPLINNSTFQFWIMTWDPLLTPSCISLIRYIQFLQFQKENMPPPLIQGLTFLKGKMITEITKIRFESNEIILFMHF